MPSAKFEQDRTLAAKVRDYGRDLCITKNC
jgi:hypothetical protein